MTVFTWKINNLERQASNGLVTIVHWSVTAVDGDYTSSIVNTLSVERGQDFTEFDDLTEQDVIGWVQEAVGKNTVEAALSSMINAQKTPVVINGLPWSTGE